METLSLLKSTVKMYQKGVNDRILSVKMRLSETGSHIGNKLTLIRDSVNAKSMQIYARAQETIERIPVPVKVKQACMALKTQTGFFVVYVQKGFLKICGVVGDVLVRMKVKINDASKFIQAKALETVGRVSKAIEPYVEKAKSGMLSIKGRVGDIIVDANKKVSTKVAETYGRMKKAIEDLPLTAKITNGINVVQTKAGNIVICVKDGYMHVTSKVGEKIVYIKAQVVQTHGAVKVKILTTYTGTKSMINNITSTAITNVVSATELAKQRVLTAVDNSKKLAADKPVATSAAGGAVLGGASGGAVGLASGGLVGAACGMPLAIFTFGLSIPVGAVIGGSVGACTGVTVGGAAGAVGGSAAGYGFEHRAQIKTGVRTGMDGAMKKVTSLQDLGKSLKTKLRSETGSTV